MNILYTQNFPSRCSDRNFTSNLWVNFFSYDKIFLTILAAHPLTFFLQERTLHLF